MTFQLSTQRLTLRPFSPSDAADALSVYGDDRVLRFWTSGPLRTCDEAREWCAEQEAAHEQRGYAQWRVAERDGPFVGCVGLQPLETGEIELVYALRPDMWGRGYARESADAALAFAFGQLHMDEVVAIVRPANDASVRVARAVGMVRKGVGTYFGSAWDRYVIERATWAAQSGTPSVRLRTPRLELRCFREDDLEALSGVLGDPEVMRYVGTRRTPLTRDEVREALRRAEQHWAKHGFGPLAVVETASDTVVGDSGLQMLEGGPDVELTYTLARRAWGRGLATETAAAALAWGFGDLGLRRLVAVADRANAASHRVLEKAGFRRAGVRHCYGADLDEFVAEAPARVGDSSRPGA